MSRRVLLFSLVLLLAGSAVGGAVAALRPRGAAPAAASPPPAPLPTIPPPPPADPVAQLPPPLPASSPGAPAFDVASVQRRLTELLYYVGPADGKVGAALRSAVMAFQKVHGLGADGVVGAQTLQALANPLTPELRRGPATRIEVDLTKQVLYVIEGGSLVRILPISSGSGQAYRTKSGGTARSLTPAGWFTIERRIKGVRKADLGVLYDPMYFYKGWAIHGSNSVPAYPASHGCVRVTRRDAVWLFNRVPNGTPVHLYGGTHTFTAGSSAPGTDDPAGDTGGADAAPAPSSSPSAPPSAEPTDAPSTEPADAPSAEPTGAPTPSESPPASPPASPGPLPAP